MRAEGAGTGCRGKGNAELNSQVPARLAQSLAKHKGRSFSELKTFLKCTPQPAGHRGAARGMEGVSQPAPPAAQRPAPACCYWQPWANSSGKQAR